MGLHINNYNRELFNTLLLIHYTEPLFSLIDVGVRRFSTNDDVLVVLAGADALITNRTPSTTELIYIGLSLISKCDSLLGLGSRF